MAYTIHYIGATWCSTCKTIKPKTEELAKRFSVPLLVKDLDADLADEEKETVTKVPTIRIFEGDRQIVELNTNQVASLESWLQGNVRMTVDDLF